MDIRNIFALTITCVLLCGCHQKSNQVVTVDPKSADTNANEQALVSTHFKDVKPGAQVSLASEKLINVTANKAIFVDILLSANVSVGGLHVVLNPSDGLQILNGLQSFDFASNDIGQYKIPVELSAEKNGRYYLNIMATINGADTTSSRSLAVIVQVGDVAVSGQIQVNKMLKESSTEEVKVLPAQEQVIH